MTTVELISTKLQEILGAKYEVKPFSFFARDYIQPMTTPYGTVYDVKYQAFEEMQGIIPVCVNMQETSPINSDFFYRTGIMTLQFYVPINAIGRGDNKEFDFFGDYERLRAKLTDGRISLITFKTDGSVLPGQEEVDKIYKAYFTLTEPSTNGTVQGTGAYSRMVYTVQGNVTVLENELRTGDDYTIDIFDGNNYVPFNNITNVTIARDEQGNAVQNEGTTNAMTPPVSRVHSVSFVVSDKSDDLAVEILRNAVFKMQEKYVSYNTNIADTEAKQREMLIRIKDHESVLAEFWALLSASYNVGGKTSVGSFSVSLTRTEDIVQSAR